MPTTRWLGPRQAGYDKATELVFIPNDDELTRAQGQAGT